jgi:hypothetical protein
MVFVTQFMRCELFSKQSAIALALSTGWNFGPEGPWMAVDALDPSLFAMDFAMCSIAWGVTSVFVSFIYHRSSAFFRVMRVIAFETQFTAVLHPGSLAYCHNFLIFFLYLKRRPRAGISLFKSDKVIFFVDSLYVDAIEAVKARWFIGRSRSHNYNWR